MSPFFCVFCVNVCCLQQNKEKKMSRAVCLYENYASSEKRYLLLMYKKKTRQFFLSMIIENDNQFCGFFFHLRPLIKRHMINKWLGRETFHTRVDNVEEIFCANKNKLIEAYRLRAQLKWFNYNGNCFHAQSIIIVLLSFWVLRVRWSKIICAQS